MPFTAAILAIILTYIWVLDPRTPRAFVMIPIATVGLLGCWRALLTHEWGFKQSAFWPALRASSLVTIAAVAAILVAGAALGTLHDRPDFLGTLAPLIVWGGAQQWILQTVALREAQRVTDRFGVLLAAALFAVIHLPNPFLTVVTFAGGLAWCSIYARYPHILPLALSHALGTLAILYAFDDAITGRLRIGYSYLQMWR